MVVSTLALALADADVVGDTRPTGCTEDCVSTLVNSSMSGRFDEGSGFVVLLVLVLFASFVVAVDICFLRIDLSLGLSVAAGEVSSPGVAGFWLLREEVDASRRSGSSLFVLPPFWDW